MTHEMKIHTQKLIKKAESEKNLTIKKILIEEAIFYEEVATTQLEQIEPVTAKTLPIKLKLAKKLKTMPLFKIK